VRGERATTRGARSADLHQALQGYRGTSLVRNCLLLRPYSRTIPRALWWSLARGWVFSYERGTPVPEVSLYSSAHQGPQPENFLVFAFPVPCTEEPTPRPPLTTSHLFPKYRNISLYSIKALESLPRRSIQSWTWSGNTTPCRMTGVTLHGVVSPGLAARLKEGCSQAWTSITICVLRTVQGYLAHKKPSPP